MHFVKAKGILSAAGGINIYRGCSHGCIYCDSRSECYGIKHPFEDIEVKENAPKLLEQALRSKRKKCMIGTGAMCDPYLPAEEELLLTRQCLKIIDRYEFGVSVLTKSSRILRDMDLLSSINGKARAVVMMTLTTCDEVLCSRIEPNVSTTKERYEALCEFTKAGIPVIVWLGPILPFINDTEDNLNGILDYCISAGVTGVLSFGMGVTLRSGNREYFYEKLDELFPGVKEKYIKTFGNACVCPSPHEKKLADLFHERCHASGIISDPGKCLEFMNTLPQRYIQTSMFA